MSDKISITGKIFRSIPFFLALSTLVATALYFSLNRFVGRDEGYYLYAARDVLSGRLPYINFFFPQMPLQPYVYALPFSLFGASWVVGRIFAGLLTIAGGLILHRIARYHYDSSFAALALFLYATSSTILVWSSTAETYSLSILLCLGAVALYRTAGRYSLAGIVFGLCITTRLTFLPLVAIMIWEIARMNRGQALPVLRKFITGLFLGLTPALLLFALSPDNFIFNNLLYHLSKSAHSDAYFDRQRGKIFLSLIGLRESSGLNTFQYCFFLYTATLGALWKTVKGKGADFNWIFGISLIAIHLLPSPPYLQYFSVAVPWLILSASGFIMLILRHLAAEGRKFGQALACIMTLGLAYPYFSTAYSSLKQYTITGEKVIGVGDKNADNWRISTISMVSRRLDDYLEPGERVFASWPGYLLESRGRALCRTENHFGVQYARRTPLTHEQRVKLRIKRPVKIVAAFDSRKISTAVVYTGRERSTPMREELLKLGAVEKEVVDGIVILDRARG